MARVARASKRRAASTPRQQSRRTGALRSRETVVSYEAGVKAAFWDRKVRANFAVFYNDYKGTPGPRLCSTVLDPITNPPSPELTIHQRRQAGIGGAELEIFATRSTAPARRAAQHGRPAMASSMTCASSPSAAAAPSRPRPSSPKWDRPHRRLLRLRPGMTGHDHFGRLGPLLLTHGAGGRQHVDQLGDRDPGLFQDAHCSTTPARVGVTPRHVLGRALRQEPLRRGLRTDGQSSPRSAIRTVYFGAP